MNLKNNKQRGYHKSYIMIIGSMKSGTTTLYNYLKEHPEICPCLTKEPEYFSEKQEHGFEAETYEELFDFDKKIHKYGLEASTGYTKYPYEQNIPNKIKAYGLKPKFIYLVRNPYDRIVSQYVHVVKDDQQYSFEDMFTHLIDYSKYYMQISEYTNLFPFEDVLVIDFADLKKSPKQVLKRIYNFTGLKKAYYPDISFNHNKTTGLGKKPRALQLKIDKKLNFLPNVVRGIAKELVRLRYKAKPLILADDHKKMIYEHLKEDMLKLKNEHGVNTDKWGFN